MVMDIVRNTAVSMAGFFGATNPQQVEQTLRTEMGSQLARYKEEIESLRKETKEASNKQSQEIAELRELIKELQKGTLEKLGDKMKKLGAKIKEWAQAFWNSKPMRAIREFSNKIWNSDVVKKLRGYVSAAVSNIGTFFKVMGEWFGKNVAKPVGKFLGDVGDRIVRSAPEIGHGIVEAAKAAGKTVGAGLQQAARTMGKGLVVAGGGTYQAPEKNKGLWAEARKHGAKAKKAMQRAGREFGISKAKAEALEKAKAALQDAQRPIEKRLMEKGEGFRDDTIVDRVIRKRQLPPKKQQKPRSREI